jgi:hypothetical protein
MADTLDLPVIEVGDFLAGSAAGEECRRAADAFHRFGCVAVRDPRVHFEDNEVFLSMMERYFESSDGVRGACHMLFSSVADEAKTPGQTCISKSASPQTTWRDLGSVFRIMFSLVHHIYIRIIAPDSVATDLMINLCLLALPNTTQSGVSFGELDRNRAARCSLI